MAKVGKVGSKKTTPVANIVPPEGGRIHFVRVPVQLDREWQEVINAAGPNTPEGYNVRKVGDQYPPAGMGIVEVDVEAEIILVNFSSNDGSWNRAIAWAKQYHLKRTNPRHVFAIGEHKPQFHRELGVNYNMYAVATEECIFEGFRRVCILLWVGSRRMAGLVWVEDCGGSIEWFAFLRE